jgi:hypothetical protein
MKKYQQILLMIVMIAIISSLFNGWEGFVLYAIAGAACTPLNRKINN